MSPLLNPSTEGEFCVKVILFCITMFKIFWLHPVACGTLVFQPGIELAPPALEGGVLTTGLPEKFQGNFRD